MNALGVLLLLAALAGGEEVDRTWHDTDRAVVASEIPLRDGKAHGLTRTFRADGTLDSACDFVDGQRQGRLRQYAADGTTVIREVPYAADREEGVETRWFPSGAKHEEIPWRAGVRQGVARTWTAAGALVWERPWADGRLHGTVRAWGADGRLISSETYRDGERIAAEQP